jgi:outer membrane protein OmpA-like peptidoglycan-associated protein
MRKLLVSTTALSVAISPLATMPGFAQVLNEDGSITGADGAVLCATVADPTCDTVAIVEALKAIDPAAGDALQQTIAARLTAEAEAQAAAQAAAEAEAAAQAEAEAAAQAAAEAEAAAQAEAEAAAQAAAEAEAAAQAEAEAAAQAAADAEAAAQAEAEAAAQAAAAAEAAAQAEAEAAAQAAAEAEAAAQAEAEAAAQTAAEAEAAALAEAEAAAQAAAEAEAAAQAEAEAAAQAAADEAAAEAAAAAEPAAGAEDATALLPEPSADTAMEAPSEGAIDPATGAPLDAEAAAAAAAALAAAEAELTVSDTGEIIDPAAGLKVAEPVAVDPAEVVDAPVISATEVEGLTEILTVDPTAIAPETVAAAATAAAPAAADGTAAPTDPSVLLGAVTETITADTVRTSAQEFAAAPVAVGEGKKSGLSNLEKAGLVVLGALAVGAIIKSNNNRQEERRVVSNTGDRVVMLLPDGSYQVLKDDDTVIRQPGSTVRTETFRDGSTRTIVERQDGTQVVTIRDATGRVLRRATYDDRGREIVLIDDLQREEVVIVEDLPRPRQRIVISSKDNDAALKRELAAIEAERAGRSFSLRQIREIPQVRALAATIDVEPVTFASGSAAIAASEARNLADLGRVMQDLLDLNPREVFLIEGHTDATGTGALNLALSDRRAESVALALTEYFDIPPENMVVQGYGETELLIDTLENEPRNRRVEVRVITPLMRTAALR